MIPATSPEPAAAPLRRKVYMVLSPRALPYARTALASLLANAGEALELTLITDSSADATELRETLQVFEPDGRHLCRVSAQAELDDTEATRFAGLDRLRAFRHGHPCWRKVTDPLLLSAPGDELVLLDPDLYFPNRFHFEPTPLTGLLLMWQKPNCLLPPEIVRRALSSGIALARHVDIGVSHWRAGSDLEWLDWLLGRLAGVDPLPRLMHVEAIVWAAIAMREGGGYLDPAHWVCWHRTQPKRVQLKLGTRGVQLLGAEPWTSMKCFHAGGEAKWWVPAYVAGHPGTPNEVFTSGTIVPFTRLTPQRYSCEQGAKDALRGLGYYRLFGSRPA